MDTHNTMQQPAQYHHLQDAPHDKAEQFHQPAYEPYQPHHSDVPQGAGPTVLSVTRGVALAAIGLILFLLLAVVGLSAGLGVSQRDLSQAKTGLEAAQAALSAATA